MQSEYFIFDGIKSVDMEVYLIHMESGLVSSPFFGGQDIHESRSRNKILPYHYGTTRNAIEFTIQISPLEKEWTPQLRNKIGKWLIHDTYKSFQTADDLGKIFYVICTEAPNFELAHNKGYLELTFTSNSSFAWSPIYIESFNLSDNTTSKIIELENKSNVLKYYYPKIEIELIDSETDIQIKNLSDGGRIFELKDLKPNEIVSIDCENQIMVSSNPLSNPFGKFNRKWLRLVYGVNQLEIKGQCVVKIKSQFPIAQ